MTGQEAAREYKRKWREKNREQIRQYNKKYWEKKAAQMEAAEKKEGKADALAQNQTRP